MSVRENITKLSLSLAKQPVTIACPHCNRWVYLYPPHKDLVGRKEFNLNGICEGCNRSYELWLEIKALLSLEEK